MIFDLKSSSSHNNTNIAWFQVINLKLCTDLLSTTACLEVQLESFQKASSEMVKIKSVRFQVTTAIRTSLKGFNETSTVSFLDYRVHSTNKISKPHQRRSRTGLTGFKDKSQGIQELVQRTSQKL